MVGRGTSKLERKVGRQTTGRDQTGWATDGSSRASTGVAQRFEQVRCSKTAGAVQQKTPYGTRLTVPKSEHARPLPSVPADRAGMGEGSEQQPRAMRPSCTQAGASSARSSRRGDGSSRPHKVLPLPPWASLVAMEAPGAREAVQASHNASPSVTFNAARDERGGRPPFGVRPASHVSGASKRTEARGSRRGQVLPQDASPDNAVAQQGARFAQGQSEDAAEARQPRADWSRVHQTVGNSSHGGVGIGEDGGRPAWAAMLPIQRTSTSSSDVESTLTQGTSVACTVLLRVSRPYALSHVDAVRTNSKILNDVTIGLHPKP